jgi:hypothetical protein
MLDPFESQPDSGSYVNLQKRMLKKVQAAGVNDHIIEVLRKAYEDALANENIVLSRPERKRLFKQIVKLVLEDVIKKLDDGSISI